MTKKEDIWPVIVRYLDNSIDESESLKLENWLDECNENRRTLHGIDRIWKASEEKTPDALINELNLEKDWYRVAEHINASNPEEKRARIRHFRKLRKRQLIFSNVLKVAALVLVAFTSVLITLQFAPKVVETQSEPVFNEIATNSGERANIELGDGSKVMLNAASKLLMPESFSSKRRDVQLEGQAYFNVKSDRNRPFYIHTDNAIVEVIGTSFDVRSYHDDDDMFVVVREGTIELRRLDDPDNRLVVNEGYKGTVSKSNGRLSIELIEDPDFYFGWMEGRLIFKKTPIADVFKHIERWYDVSVQYDESDEELMSKKFTADLKTRSVREVLEVLHVSMGINFKILGDDVKIINNESV
jgi:transmembrane sensor